jgi:hypothetical protein
MKLLGYEYNKDGILKMQKRYFKRAKDCDGIYGADTDKLLRHLHHVKVYTKNFKPEEFRCPCGHCTGYPTWMRVNALKHIQTIRDHYGKPMTITSGLRCEYENSRLSGSSRESAHMDGKAVDFYMSGVTDTLDHRKKAINYIKKLKHHGYTYGNGISSTGAYVVAPNMGNALHTQTK